ncbi:MAG: DUF2244 domain-containing protein [Wenzhouxiangella sp.]
MIATQSIENHADCVVIEAMSNVSITLDRLVAIFAGLCLVTLAVIAWPVVMGLWPMLVVAVLHLAAVGWCLRSAWRKNWARERIRVENDRLIVEHYRAGHQASSQWPVAWTRVQLEHDRSGDLRVFVTSQGRRQQIGAFLPVAERARLARMLDRALHPLSAWSGANSIQVS